MILALYRPTYKWRAPLLAQRNAESLTLSHPSAGPSDGYTVPAPVPETSYSGPVPVAIHELPAPDLSQGYHPQITSPKCRIVSIIPNLKCIIQLPIL